MFILTIFCNWSCSRSFSILLFYDCPTQVLVVVTVVLLNLASLFKYATLFRWIDAAHKGFYSHISYIIITNFILTVLDKILVLFVQVSISAKVSMHF